MKNLSILLTAFIMVGFSPNSEWTVLFDGKTVKGLRGYKQSGFPDSWEVVDGTLKTVPGHGVDLISEEVYKNFELELEWKVPKGGNSGIFYFATEEGNYIWQSAPEMQVVDDEKHTDGKNTLTSAGALYALIAPSTNVVKPVGEFNQVRIKVKNNHVEHWLNGTKIVEYVYGSDMMWDLVAKSKFNKMPLFAKASEGHIGLQGDHGLIWYKNIRIRRL
ncbi:MAG: glycosyl hydrolase [Candidatus Neomarinimicrobiota bacterium]|nr:MAG: glycosyl hydrolase [Candidatus Neomarinimicrobiota bacterium]